MNDNGVRFWRSVVTACQALAGELSTSALPALATELMRGLGGNTSVFVFLRDADDLVLRAQSGASVPPLAFAQSVDQTIITVDADLALPLVAGEVSRGVVVVRGAVDDMLRAGLEAVAAQLAICFGQATVYEELESLVEREMLAAVEREEAMQLVLDSMADGLLVCDLCGVVSQIRSKVTTDWFGEPGSDSTVWSYLGAEDALFTSEFELAFLEMAEDFLPFESNAALVPKLLRRGDRAYAFDCRQVFRDGVFTQIAITVRDVTSALEQENAARAARELPDIVSHVLRDRDGFREMLKNTEQLLEELGLVDEPTVRARTIHTLKGNASIWGFASFSAACHALEDVLDGDASTLEPAQIIALATAWDESLRGIRVFLDQERGDATVPKLHVTPRDHEALLELLERREDQTVVAAVVRGWTQPHLATPLTTLARQAERLAEGLGKRITVIVDAEGRAPELPIAALVAELVHAVRNALDHGIETAEERIASGKPPSATLRLGARTTATDFEMTVEDDGRGIDWDAVRARTVALGMPVTTAHEALFAMGFSTRDSASAMSGRGVGMAAVRSAFRELGGDVVVESRAGLGTRVVGRVPLGAAPPASRHAA